MSIVLVRAQNTEQENVIDGCSICKVIVPRLLEVLKTPSQIDLSRIDTTLCEGMPYEACSNFMMIYGRSIIRRAYFLGQENLCEWLPSYQSLLVGRPQPLCSQEVDTDDLALPLSDTALQSFNAFMRIALALSGTQVQESPESEIAEGFIQRTDFVVQNDGDILQSTQNIHFKVNENGVVSTDLPVVTNELIHTHAVAQSIEMASNTQNELTSSHNNIFGIPSSHLLSVGILFILIGLIFWLMPDDDEDEKVEHLPMPEKMHVLTPTWAGATPISDRKEKIDF